MNKFSKDELYLILGGLHAYRPFIISLGNVFKFDTLEIRKEIEKLEHKISLEVERM